MNASTSIVKILFLAANPGEPNVGIWTKRCAASRFRWKGLKNERSSRSSRSGPSRTTICGGRCWTTSQRSSTSQVKEVAPGLAFVDSAGQLQVISGEALARLFELCAEHVRCVVLNACFSEVQAKVISKHIEFVIGMSQEIGDAASIKFSEGFYDALGGEATQIAFDWGKNAVNLGSLEDYLVPILLRNAEVRRLSLSLWDGNRHGRVVPRGLRSFGAEDSDFYLDLLPGVRDKDGLPLSLRFWKARIEEADSQATFPVGLIYGQSGCGKSSFVKAGLLPRLSEKIATVLVEATASDTETRLNNGLRGICAGSRDGTSLVEKLIALQRKFEATGQKTLIVIDQFEQWLHGRSSDETSELAAALRLCDGARIQCILMVRDDFWVAVTQFLRVVGVRISDGDNSALVELFDGRHARKVLSLFGEAYGAWDGQSVESTQERDKFLDRTVSGLAQDGHVIPIRLALFCELFKGRPWTLESIKQVGGVEGVGVNYLEETFSSETAPAEHRHHQKAARSVLSALLPESGIQIKGNMRSHAELLEVSGYSKRPDEFEDVLQILDRKTRLVTPTVPGVPGDEDSAPTTPATERFYQLTHDYLVPSLREWLTRKQKETRRGARRDPPGGACRTLERETREPPPAIGLGVDQHSCLDEAERLDRTAAADDEDGSAGSWNARLDAPRARSGHLHFRPDDSPSRSRRSAKDSFRRAGPGTSSCQYRRCARDHLGHAELSTVGRSDSERRIS